MELLAQTLMSVTWQIRVMNKLRVIIPFPDSGEPTYLNSFIQTLEGIFSNVFIFISIPLDLYWVTSYNFSSIFA